MESTATERLIQIYDHVMSWLHFAEAKNAVLITFSSGVIFAIATVYSQLQNSPPVWVAAILIWISAFSFVASVFSAISFLPQVRLLHWSGQKGGRGSNVHFFGHIADMGTEMYATEFCKKTGIPNLSDADRDIIQQIVINSRIARKKYAIFSTALWFFMIGLTSPVGFIVIRRWLIEESH